MMKRRISPGALVLFSILMLSGLVNLPRHIRAGRFTLLALLTIASTLVVWTVWFIRPRFPSSSRLVAGAFLAFIGWAIVGLIQFGATIAGVHTLIVQILFLGALLLGCCVEHDKPEFQSEIARVVRLSLWVASGLYLITIAGRGLGAGGFMGPRSFALFALIGLCWHLAAWRQGRAASLWVVAFTTLMIAVSLSRLALAIGTLLIPLSRLSAGNLRSWIRTIGFIALTSVALLLAVNRFEPLHNRFFAGDVAVSIGDRNLNTQGRSQLWDTTWDSFLESPWLGKGPGSAEVLLREKFALDHPHNDYLRILHDHGIVGMALFVLAWGTLVVALSRKWKATKEPRSRVVIHAAGLGIAVVVLGMITDNPIVYTFVMVPLGVFSGVALAAPGFESMNGRVRQEVVISA